MLPNEEIRIGRDVSETIAIAADRIFQTLSQFSILNSQSSTCIALSGGRTPAALYQLLTQPPYRDRVNWKNIEWFWGDERTVPPDHADSNYRMARETLLAPLAIDESRIHRMPAERPDRYRAAEEYEQVIRSKVKPVNAAGIPMFDLVLLGIGSDGHTASLFPNSVALQEKQRLVVANYVPSQQTWRITMTFPLLLAARHIMFLVCGADKAEAMERIIKARSGEESPPAATLRTSTGRISWILDAPAARLVSTPPTT